jgi:uncharacterized protein (TIGR03905 family)
MLTFLLGENKLETISFKTRGVCSREIAIDVENGILKHVLFKSGCDGNLSGISRLVEGMPVEAVIEKLKGIDCDGKGTSCPDQLAKALEEYQKKAI